MGKFTIARYFDFSGTLELETLFVSSASKSKVVYADLEGGGEIFIEGRNLRMDHGTPESGIVTKLTIKTSDGTTFSVVSGFKLNVENLGGDTAIDFVNAILGTAELRNTKHIGSDVADSISAFRGNDILLGRGGDDLLSGGRGNDRLTGGDGSDIFVFKATFGNDTVADFDADGGAGNQDFIKGVFADATITQSGENAVLDFGDGDVLTLLNVNAAQITGADFVV